MQFLILTDSQSISVRGDNSSRFSLNKFFEALLSPTEMKDSQVVELLSNQSIQSQIDAALDNLDIDSLLDPNMPNSGGMEILATIKRDLRFQLESFLSTPNV